MTEFDSPIIAGSLYLRNGVKNIQLMYVDAPTFRAGCGGIDLFLGGFSFVDAAQLTAFFKQVLSKAAAYSLVLALETEVPEIQHAMAYIQGIAQKVNNSNLNSCETAESLVGGVWAKNSAAQHQICKDIGSQNNVFSDWADARQKCGVGGENEEKNESEFNKQMNSASQDPKYKSQVTINKNLVWDAIMQNGFMSQDKDLAEFFMSLSGTITYDGNGKPTVYYPLSSDRNLIKALLIGGDADIYKCSDTDKCLNLTKHTIKIALDKGLKAQAIIVINDLVDSARNDTPLTSKQKGFLEATSIPVLKFITVGLELSNASEALNIASYSDMIAKDLLKQYMLEVLNLVKQSVTSTSDYTAEIKQQLIDQIQKSLVDVERIDVAASSDIENANALVGSVKALEQEVTANMTDQMKDALNTRGAI